MEGEGRYGGKGGIWWERGNKVGEYGEYGGRGGSGSLYQGPVLGRALWTVHEKSGPIR